MYITKVVKQNGKKKLVRRSLSEVVDYRLPISKLSLVLVLFRDAQEGVEKSLWCYAHGSMPFIGDANNVVATSKSATQFQVDTLLCDVSSLHMCIEDGRIPKSVETIVVIDAPKEFTFPKEINEQYVCSYVSESGGN